MYSIARRLPPKAIDAILAKHYALAERTHAPVEPESGRCALAVGLNALGLAVHGRPRANTVALGLVAYRLGWVDAFNRHGNNVLWHLAMIAVHGREIARIREEAATFIYAFDRGNLSQRSLWVALGRRAAWDRQHRSTRVRRVYMCEGEWRAVSLRIVPASAPELTVVK